MMAKGLILAGGILAVVGGVLAIILGILCIDEFFNSK